MGEHPSVRNLEALERVEATCLKKILQILRFTTSRRAYALVKENFLTNGLKLKYGEGTTCIRDI
jgi:hypothetical protein